MTIRLLFLTNCTKFQYQEVLTVSTGRPSNMTSISLKPMTNKYRKQFQVTIKYLNHLTISPKTHVVAKFHCRCLSPAHHDARRSWRPLTLCRHCPRKPYLAMKGFYLGPYYDLVLFLTRSKLERYRVSDWPVYCSPPITALNAVLFWSRSTSKKLVLSPLIEVIDHSRPIAIVHDLLPRYCNNVRK